jgi:hypothetical protein
MAMAAIERDSVKSEFHDFKWHRQHRGRRNVQFVDVVMVLAWAALVGWMRVSPDCQEHVIARAAKKRITGYRPIAPRPVSFVSDQFSV